MRGLSSNIEGSRIQEESDMDRRTTGIIATVVAVLLCGCPGLIVLCFGATFALTGSTPGASTDVFGSNDPEAALAAGFVALCLGLIMVAIPVVVGFLTLREKKSELQPPISDEPLPPPL